MGLLLVLDRGFNYYRLGLGDEMTRQCKTYMSNDQVPLETETSNRSFGHIDCRRNRMNNIVHCVTQGEFLGFVFGVLFMLLIGLTFAMTAR